MARRTNHSASTSVNDTAATMIISSPLPPRPPTPSVDATYSSSRAFFSNVATILIILACVSLLAFSLHAAARFLLRRLARRRTAQPQPQPLPPKPLSDGGAADRSVGTEAGAGVPVAGAWAEAECEICLSELADGARVLPHLPRAVSAG